MKNKVGFELITLGHLLKRERDRSNDDIKNRVLGEGNNVMCTDLGIIGFLADNKEKEVYQKDIEQFFSLTAPSVSNKLRDLAKKDLVTREYSKVDTRLKQVLMTDKAEAIDIKMRDEIENFENRLDSLITTEEKEQLLSILTKIKTDFE